MRLSKSFLQPPENRPCLSKTSTTDSRDAMLANPPTETKVLEDSCRLEAGNVRHRLGLVDTLALEMNCVDFCALSRNHAPRLLNKEAGLWEIMSSGAF